MEREKFGISLWHIDKQGVLLTLEREREGEEREREREREGGERKENEKELEEETYVHNFKIKNWEGCEMSYI